MLRLLLHHMALLGTAQGVGLSGAEEGAATDFSVLRWGYLPTVSTVRFMVFPPASAATAAQYDLRLAGSAGGTIAKTTGSLPTPTHGVSWGIAVCCLLVAPSWLLNCLLFAACCSLIAARCLFRAV